ncbi:hypothetical protein GGQ54_000354 [Naumannella cuiyingiana]|uniref:FHA domain-containing protein n=1 Tax=Naumannella cuiyingiana TaxID=1347891 RepID=A0A7Z0D6J7_9ACTN|nr:FHA domain-containing protein [Naumannella cuiyingiana]NYI69794.1 hypothetical protein [Naumannella cuiyingiana]
MPTCPAGHASTATDYCDVCGTPLNGAGDAAPAPVAGQSPAPDAAAAPDAGRGGPAPDRPAARDCPHCGAGNAAGALFCEACGYDFTTGTLPRGGLLDLDAPPVGRRGAGPVPDAPSGPPAPAAPPAPQPPAPEQPAPQPPAPTAPAAPPAPQPPAPEQPAPEQPTPQSAAPAGSSPARATPTPEPGPASQATPDRPANISPSTDADWVAELWIDPEWYAMQESPDPMPSPGLPRIVPLRNRSLLIGRVSRSRNIHPDIDCDPDSGISRRHAQLTTDGTRWWVEDLDSANGTFVAATGLPLPADPLPSGERRELGPDDRLFLGAWTRISLRPAAPGELTAG